MVAFSTPARCCRASPWCRIVGGDGLLGSSQPDRNCVMEEEADVKPWCTLCVGVSVSRKYSSTLLSTLVWAAELICDVFNGIQSCGSGDNLQTQRR